MLLKVLTMVTLWVYRMELRMELQTATRLGLLKDPTRVRPLGTR